MLSHLNQQRTPLRSLLWFARSRPELRVLLWLQETKVLTTAFLSGSVSLDTPDGVPVQFATSFLSPARLCVVGLSGKPCLGTGYVGSSSAETIKWINLYEWHQNVPASRSGNDDKRHISP
jgi:hypothetical protein